MAERGDKTPCDLCKKQRWLHQATTLACPWGKWNFHATDRFTTGGRTEGLTG